MIRNAFLAVAAASVLGAAPPAWVARSNEHAKVALEPIARFSPEGAASLGMSGYDEGIFDLKEQFAERAIEASRNALAELQKRLAAEKDPLVRQDLEILVNAVKENIEGAELNRKHQLPYLNMGQVVFGGLRALLDDQVAESRRSAAVVRLRKYAGVEQGYTPITVLAEQRTRERLNVPGLLGPPRDQVEKDLQTSAYFIDGLAQLFQKYKLTGWEEAHAKLKTQIAAYNNFIRKEILPKSRTDFKLPPELYSYNLRNLGVDIPPAKLAAIAHAAFDDLQKQMNAVAAKIAKERGWQFTDYRQVVRELKKQQLEGEQILVHYKKRIAQIEEIIRRENLVSLPDRPARMRLASPAESAQQPAPNMRPPRLIGNTGESGEFVLPLVNPAAQGSGLTTSRSKLRPGR